MTEITAHGAILPCLQPPQWPSAGAAMCEPLIGDDPLWNGNVAQPWVAYGVDTPSAFEPFKADPEQLNALRAAARASLPSLTLSLSRLDFDALSVIDLHGSYFASEAILDPARMRDLEAKLHCEMLAVGIPCRGHAYVTSGNQPTASLRRFFELVAEQHAAAQQPLFTLPVLVQRGELVGLLRMLSDDDFEGHETLLL